MTPESLKLALSERFGVDAVVTHLERKDLFMDVGTKQTWRDHLRRVFEHRLIGAKERGVCDGVISEVHCLLKALNEFTPDKALYSFSADCSSTRYAGWAIDEDIVYCAVIPATA